jgi:hypothetical protein
MFGLIKVLLITFFLWFFVRETKAQINRRPNLETNAHDTVTTYEEISLNGGLGDGYRINKKLGSEFVYSPRMLKEKGRIPEFPAGGSVLNKYFTSIICPCKYNGRIIVQFIVEYNGKLSNIKIISGLGEADELKKMERAAKHCPRWIPGILNNKFVRAQSVIAVDVTTPD